MSTTLLTFRTTVSLLHYCKGYYTFYPPKVPASGPLIYSKFSFVFASRQRWALHLSFAVYQGLLISKAADCHHRLCLHRHCLLLCALDKDPAHTTFSRWCLCSRLGKFTRTMSKHFCENYCTLFPALKQKGGSTKCSLLGLQSALMPLSSTTFGVGCYILALLWPQRHAGYFWALLLTMSICPLPHHGPVWQKRIWNAYLLTGAAECNYNLSIWMITEQKCQGPLCCPSIPSRLLTKLHDC